MVQKAKKKERKLKYYTPVNIIENNFKLNQF